MTHAHPLPRALIWTLSALAALLVLAIGLLSAVALMDANRLRAPLERYIAARSHRHVQISGPLSVRVFSLTPAITVGGLTLGNPAWTPAGTFADIGKLSLTFELPGWRRPLAVARLELHDTTLYLQRDEAGLANWQWSDPRTADSFSQGAPLLRDLATSNIRIQLNDARRHLKYVGIVSARSHRDGHEGLRIIGQGQLNGRAAVLVLDGDALGSVSRKKPYRFGFAVRSSGSHLTGEGSLPRPFDVSYMNVSFRASGRDLKDLYFLTGLRLLDTGKYALSGKLTREGMQFRYSDLAIRSGESDLTARISIDASTLPSHIEATLHSRMLRLANLGEKAAGREPVAPSSGLLSDKPLSLIGIVGRDMRIHFEADAIIARRISVRGVSADISVSEGVLNALFRSAQFLQGNLHGRLRVDASHPQPAARLNLTATNADIGQLSAHDSQTRPPEPPVLDGALAARVSLSGRGHSIHELASTATGSVDLALTHGALRKSLAELSGIDLRGLGLLVAGDKQQTEARCGVASFAAQNGILQLNTLVLDTEPVLITGSGSIDLGKETIDMEIRGHPKHLRLRLRAPATIQGSLRHPAVRMAKRGVLGQAGAAAALGVLLTPFAAALTLIDPGLAKDTDCDQLIRAGQDRQSEKLTAPGSAHKGVGGPRREK